MSWLRHAVLAYSRAQHATMRAHESGHAFVEGILVRALSPEQKTRLTVDIFDARGRRESGTRTLSAWEQHWFRERLPAPPARVSLAAAGNGAEARWLCDAGYEVLASEPAGSCLSQLTAAVGARGSVSQASFQDLIDAKPTPCDAAVVGWSAFSHLLEPNAQLALLRALHACCPRGPILLSFYWFDALQAPRQSRAWNHGARIGVALARLRGRASAAHGVERFFGHAGFGHSYTSDELDALARAVGRKVELELIDYPHATLLPA